MENGCNNKHPKKTLSVTLIVAIVSILITSIIDFSDLSSYVLGFWLIIGTPFYILVWMVIFITFRKQNKKIDFDDTLSKNAVKWDEKLWNKKG